MQETFFRYQYDVVLVDYRGFGKSTGKRSEREMLSDIQYVYASLVKDYDEPHLIVYGRSLGSGFAAKIDQRKQTTLPHSRLTLL